MKRAFLSHSSEDKMIVDILANKLGENSVFYDTWDLDAGDVLPAKLADNVWDSESKWFILIASKNSMESKWVKYEINMAITRKIKDENYRIVVARIDNCTIHPELSPFLYIDSPNDSNKAVEDIVALIRSDGRGTLPIQEDWRRSIVDRYPILGSVDEVALEGYKIIILWGLYGIGKTTLSEHIANNVFNKKVSRFPLTEGHDLLRLVAELSARAKIELPESDSDQYSLFEKGFEAIEELTRQEKIIFFDDAELVTNEDRYFNDFFTLMLNKLDSLMDMPPILIASTFNPKLDSDLQEICHAIKVGPLDEKYIISILERWIKLSDPDIELPSSEDLQVIAKELYGYPLAAKLAATVVANYSVEQTASDLSHFQSIRLDIAKQLIGRSRKTLNKLQMSILEILTIADIGLTQYDISRLLEADSNAVREAIDEMFLDQLVSFERSKIQILPLMKDYFWRRINASNSLTKLSKNIAKHCKNQLVACDPKSEDFVHYCSIACRLFIISDNETEANSLAYYFKGELKEAAKRLYHNKDYELSLKYSNMWLSINPNDSSSRWLKARCLTRLEKYSNAEDELKQLETLNFSPYKLYHAWGLLYRQKGDLEKALWYFQQGLDDRPNYLPLLREKGDVLERMDNLDSAYSVLDLAYNYAPRDPFIAPKYASILEKKGFIDQAINIMEELTITFPDEASFFHRLSMLHGAKGNNEKEYENAKIAVELDSQLTEAITHLASIEIKRENKASAYELLNCLPTKIPFFSRRVRDTIYAEILLKSGKLDEARNKLNPYDYSEDPYCADVLARIEYLDGLSLFNEGQIKLAKARVEKGIKITNSSLEKYPNNYALGIVLENLNQLNGKLTIE